MEHVLRETVVIRDADGGRIPSGRYIWRGPATVPVFALENARNVVMEDVDVLVETPCEAVIVCERTRRGPGVIPSTDHTFSRVRVYGNTLAPVGVWARTTVDENNEHFTISGCTIYGVARPVVFQGQQSKGHCITNTTFESFHTAVTSDSGFAWSGKTAAVGKVACELTRIGEPVSIRDVGVETVGRLLVTSGPTTASQPVLLENVRYEADQLAADGDAIVMRHAGCLSIHGGRYGGGKQRIPRIALAGIGEQTAIVEGVTFGSYNAYRTCPIRVIASVTPRVTFTRNVYQRAEGDPTNTHARVTAWSATQMQT